jgi:hypothetical protein
MIRALELQKIIFQAMQKTTKIKDVICVTNQGDVDPKRNTCSEGIRLRFNNAIVKCSR